MEAAPVRGNNYQPLLLFFDVLAPLGGGFGSEMGVKVIPSRIGPRGQDLIGHRNEGFMGLAYDDTNLDVMIRFNSSRSRSLACDREVPENFLN